MHLATPIASAHIDVTCFPCRSKLAKREIAAIGGPKISEWQLLNDGYLRVTLENDGQLFTGVLMPSMDRTPRFNLLHSI